MPPPILMISDFMPPLPTPWIIHRWYARDPLYNNAHIYIIFYILHYSPGMRDPPLLNAIPGRFTPNTHTNLGEKLQFFLICIGLELQSLQYLCRQGYMDYHALLNTFITLTEIMSNIIDFTYGPLQDNCRIPVRPQTNWLWDI